MVEPGKEPRPKLKRRPRTSAFDVWLNRAGTFSNVVLAVFAVVAFFYTLVPLYRLAATDNALARKEIELADAQKSLDATYERMRAYSVQSFLLSLAPECTGLFDPSESHRSLAAGAAPTGDAAKRLKAELPQWQRILEADVRACLLKNADNSQFLAELRPPDREHFLTAYKRTIEAIDADRHRSLAKAKSATDDAKQDPSLLPEQGYYEAAMDQILQRSGLRYEESPEEEFQRRVASLQFKIAMDWGTRSREELLALRRLRWPKDQ